MHFLENIWWYLVLIGVMILIHELGHYWAARFFDVKVETFSFGFGPRLFGFRRGETDFRFSAILFGGYVKMAGEQPGDEEAAADPRSLMAKPRWQRLIITFAGPAINMRARGRAADRLVHAAFSQSSYTARSAGWVRRPRLEPPPRPAFTKAIRWCRWTALWTRTGKTLR